jgi:hypothetical protein
MISRDEQFERNGGDQFVSINRVYKDKSKYNRKDNKREFRKNLDSHFLCHKIWIFNFFYISLQKLTKQR